MKDLKLHMSLLICDFLDKSYPYKKVGTEL